MLLNKNILICPLDWGLGHATRCVPVISKLIEAGANVIIASDNRPLAILRKEFPDLEYITFPGYNISYSSKKWMSVKMMFNAPVILFKIYRENRLLKKIIKEKQIHAVISDNRFGAWNKNIYSIYICHQMWVKIPSPFTFLEPVLYQLNHFFIRQYDQCWIPDSPGDNNLSGELSHFKNMPVNSGFIGPLSRFSMYRQKKSAPAKFDVAVVLSGPEPQRSILEDKIMGQLSNTRIKAIVIRGVTEENSHKSIGSNIIVHSHLSTEEMLNELEASSLVICRPGYSSIMDLACLGIKALFIPTPGQTEQEYLADYFFKKGIYFFKRQDEFNLLQDIPEALKFPGISYTFDYTLLKDRINKLLAECT